MDLVREYNCSFTHWILYIFDSNWDASTDDLFTDEWMYDLFVGGNVKRGITSDPKKVSSAASSGVMLLSSRAVETFRGSAVKIPSTSFHIWSSSAASPTASNAAHKSV